ncbi:MAG: DUF3105 domain-containing protein [Thermomicrobiales bacterium]
MANQTTSKKKRTTAQGSTTSGPRPAATPETSHIPPPRAARRAELVKNQRAERRKRYQKQQRDWLLTKIGAGAVAVALLVGLGYAIYNYAEDRRLNVKPDGVQEFSYVGGDHTPQSGTPVEYTESPPVGGAHDSAWQNCRVYDQPIYNWHAVHSLEHGAVWITYQPNLPQEQINELRNKFDGQTFVLVSPYPDLQAPIVATSWNNQLELQSVDDERLDQFVRYFRQGPQTQEPNATCAGGTTVTRA